MIGLKRGDFLHHFDISVTYVPHVWYCTWKRSQLLTISMHSIAWGFQYPIHLLYQTAVLGIHKTLWGLGMDFGSLPNFFSHTAHSHWRFPHPYISVSSRNTQHRWWIFFFCWFCGICAQKGHAQLPAKVQAVQGWWGWSNASNYCLYCSFNAIVILFLYCSDFFITYYSS